MPVELETPLTSILILLLIATISKIVQKKKAILVEKRLKVKGMKEYPSKKNIATNMMQNFLKENPRKRKIVKKACLHKEQE